MKNSPNAGLLRSPGYDLTMIAGIPSLALLCGLLVHYRNDLFLAVLGADLWLLGYHHVIATYTRLAFDRESFAEHKALVIYLLPAVAALVALLVSYGGVWVVTTVYLYWQWWHYTRQSEGISKAYLRKSGGTAGSNLLLTRAAFYAVPVLGILTVSNRSPETFLFFAVRTFPVPDAVLTIAEIATVTILGLWAWDQFRTARKSGEVPVAYLAYFASHVVIYFSAYVLFTEFNYGWLTINIWHNAQYILFVWLYNNRRYNGKPEAATHFLPAISQDGRFTLYFSATLTITTVVYFFFLPYLTGTVNSAFAMNAAMASIIVYQTINFHHYVVDSVIWKLRKPTIATTLQLNRG